MELASSQAIQKGLDYILRILSFPSVVQTPYRVYNRRSGSKDSPVKQGLSACLNLPLLWRGPTRTGENPHLLWPWATLGWLSQRSSHCGISRPEWSSELYRAQTHTPERSGGPWSTFGVSTEGPSDLKWAHTHCKGHFVLRPLHGPQWTMMWLLNKIKPSPLLPKCPVTIAPRGN